MTERWISVEQLRAILQDADVVSGTQLLDSVLQDRESLRVIDASREPVDLRTMRVRYQRAMSSNGAKWHGAAEFMSFLEANATPVTGVTARGKKTNYIILLDSALTHVLASLAIDRPAKTRLTTANLAEASESDAIEFAIETIDEVALRQLLLTGIDPDIRIDALGIPAVQIAIADRNENAVKLFADFGADIELVDERGRTALSRAASAGDNNAIVSLLLTLGAEVDRRDLDGWSPLHHAAAHGYERNVHELLTSGADRYAKTPHGLTPADLAEVGGHEPPAKLLRN